MACHMTPRVKLHRPASSSGVIEYDEFAYIAWRLGYPRAAVGSSDTRYDNPCTVCC